MRRRLSLSFCFLWCLALIFIHTEVTAQNYSGHNWYFGNNTNGIRFSRSTNQPMLVNKAVPFGVGGSAVASDPINGNLLFYTDGLNIYDATHAIMPNGTGLVANTSGNQPVAIAKSPGKKTEYYVFMNTASSTTGGMISFRTVDMALFGQAVFPTPALGDATSTTNTPVTGLTGRSEAMITLPHANGEDFWLITHANGTPDYTVTLVNASGPATSTSFSGGLIEVAANFSWHPASGRIAVSPQEPNRDIEIIRFDNSNGTLTFDQRVVNTALAATTGQATFDAEWSNNGQYLYISRHGETGIQADVLQADLANPSTTLASVLPQPNTIFRSFGLQMAPDSAIYHLYQTGSAAGPFSLGTLTNTDTVASEVMYNPTAFTTNPDFKGIQFSSFAPRDTVSLSVTFTSKGTCANTPTSFFPTVKPAADSLVWDFGDGNGATEWSPVHTYDAGGAYNVKVTAFLKGDTASFTQVVNITQFDLQLSLVQDTTACVCELPVNNGKGTCPNDTSDDLSVKVQAQGGSPTFQWFGPGGILPSQTSETLRPDSAGYYYVVATEGSCFAYAGVNIKEYDSLDQRANIWYFGQNAGIDFNPLPNDPPVAISGPLNTPEGCSVISDRNGQVIFSTDGQHIFNKENTDITPTPVPPGLGGDPGSTQSALIMPVPGDETLFYIFTTQEVHGTYAYELRYSLFDLKLNNGLGGLAEYNQLLFARSTERITGSGDWLIAHEYGNNSFRAYRISSLGISNPVISSIGSDHSITAAEQGQGYMELGGGNHLAVALSNPGVSNVVEVFDFVDSSGVVTNFRTADLQSTTGQVYGVKLSPGGNKLFATLKDANSTMYEFAFDSLGMPYLKQKVNQTGELGAMQMGPDGQIYVAINHSASLGTFTANEDTTQLSAITTLQPFALAPGTQSNLGLPNFTQIIANPAQQPGFSFASLCLGDSTEFTATGKDPAIDKFDWSFGDNSGQADGGPNIKHKYAAPGTYTVTLRIYNKCENPVATYTQQVIINDIPPDPSKGVALCTGAAVLDANPANNPDYTYAWSTGDTTKTITVNAQAIYSVVITDVQGCTRNGSFLTADNRPQVEFGPDQTVCEDVPMAPLDAQNPGTTYAWTINGAASGTTQTHAVDTSVPGLFEYKVVITDPVTTCTNKDSIRYTIQPSPAFSSSAIDNTTCGASGGQISLNITGPAGSLFTYSVSGPSGTFSNTDQSTGAVPPITSLLSGTYGITVSDQVSGCATTNTQTVNDNSFTVAATQNGTCDPTIKLDVTTTPSVATALTYRVINNATGQPITGGNGTSATGAPFTTSMNVPSGSSYQVEVTQPSTGCVATSPAVTVTQGPALTVTFNTTGLCANGQLTAVAAGATSFDWSASPAGSITPTSGATVTVSTGTWNLLVTADDGAGGNCPGTGTTTITVAPPATPDFTQSDPCATQVTLTATPAGTFTYRWYQNGIMLPQGGGGQQIVVGQTENGIPYRVEVVNTLSGCVYTSPVKQVNVAGPLDVTLASTTPCEGSDFTLTATPTPPGAITYSWKYNNTVIPGQAAATLVDNRAGKFEVTATKSGCAVTREFSILLGPAYPGLLTDKGIICPDPANPDPSTKEIVLNPGDNFVSYNWFKEELPLGITTSTYTATEPGNYSVELVNSYGCPSSDKTELVEECDPRLTGPNAFRPTSAVQAGGDFSNREFYLFSFFIADTDFQVFIFNRWGEMVYQSNDRLFRWNGGYNNNATQPLPPGTYSYVVRYKSSYRPEEGIQEKRGGVVLLR